MSLETEIAELTSQASKLVGTFENKIDEINSVMESALIDFEKWRSESSISGDGIKFGSIREAVFQGCLQSTGGVNSAFGHDDFAGIADLGTDLNVYVHFKIPIKLGEQQMYHIKMSGYSYGTAKEVDETFVGYCYLDKLTAKNEKGNFSPFAYVDSNKNLILRLLIPKVYFLTIRIDALKVGIRLIERGSINAVASLNEEVDFE